LRCFDDNHDENDGDDDEKNDDKEYKGDVLS
jgi:hypothetical protein